MWDGSASRFGEHEVAEGALVTVDGDRGLVFEGRAHDDDRASHCADRARPRVAGVGDERVRDNAHRPGVVIGQLRVRTTLSAPVSAARPNTS